jgi:3-deoxy-D-manno-octulosonic-acid transferase
LTGFLIVPIMLRKLRAQGSSQIPGQVSVEPMKIFYIPYAVLSSALFMVFLPAFWLHTRITGRYRDNFKERLGIIPPEVLQKLSTHPRIWIHAVSLGEVRVAAALVKALEQVVPGCSVILSTFTKSGRDLAEKIFEGKIPVIYAPLDFVGSVHKALMTIQPDAMVFLETEIWPNWLRLSRRMGVRTAMINGRISLRSFKRYSKIRFFFREVLGDLDAFSMILPGDADRIQAMGADPKNVVINGNAKYDLLTGVTRPEVGREIRGKLEIGDHTPVFIAGSTRSGEEGMILDAYKRIWEEFPDILLIIAPRHIERSMEIGALIEGRGCNYALWTDLMKNTGQRRPRIMVVNTFGELFNIYSVGTIVFCGGSLVPLGGQNPLEPASWGKAVFYGPHMDNFLDAKVLLESANAGVEVSDAEDLGSKALWFLRHPEELNRLGERARAAILKNECAAEKHAGVIKMLLG